MGIYRSTIIDFVLRRQGFRAILGVIPSWRRIGNGTSKSFGFDLLGGAR